MSLELELSVIARGPRKHSGLGFAHIGGISVEITLGVEIIVAVSSGDLETTDLREQEHPLEQRVSERIRQMPFLVVNVPGEPGPNSERATLERNLISLVAQYRNRNPNLKNDDTLRSYSPTPEIARSDLWNVDHVSELYRQNTVLTFKQYIEQTEPPR
jgi:hypothetical protein